MCCSAACEGCAAPGAEGRSAPAPLLAAVILAWPSWLRGATDERAHDRRVVRRSFVVAGAYLGEDSPMCQKRRSYRSRGAVLVALVLVTMAFTSISWQARS